MDDPPDDTSVIRNAVKRLSSVLSRKASTTTTTLKRSKSTTFNSISSLPNKDAVPPRSALRGGRPSGISDRRVSFYDSLPCLDYGPKFTDLVVFSRESTERRGGLLLPAVTADDCRADVQFREVDGGQQSVTSSGDLQPVDRHDSSVEPVSDHRCKVVRRSRTPGNLSGNAERRRSCMDFTKAMMQENSLSLSRSRMRSLSLLSDNLLADKAARGHSPRPADREPAAFSQEVHPYQSSLRTQEQILKDDHLDNVSYAYKAHVDRSLKSMQGADERGSAYVNASLVEMHEALIHAMAENTTAGLPSTDDDESDRVDAHTEAPHPLSETDDNNAGNDKADGAFSFDMPYDSAQPSAEAVNSTGTTHFQVSPGLHSFGAYDQSYEDLRLDPALMPLPLRIRPRHPQRDSKVAL